MMVLGRIEGSVRESGLTEGVTVTLVEPAPKGLRKMLQENGDTDLRAMHFEVKFYKHRAREIVVTSEEQSCHVEWEEDRDAMTAEAPTGSVDCNDPQYNAAVWSAKRAYKVGELARVVTAGQPTRLYRCTDECKPGKGPTATTTSSGDDDDDDDRGASAGSPGWSFFAECKGASTADAPLPAGSPKWDQSYGLASNFSQDWRCPMAFGKVAVSGGKFSIPWKLRANAGEHDDVGIAVGSIDGVVTADGKATLRPKFTVETLPPEVTQGLHLHGDAAMARLRTFTPTLAFVIDTGKMNPKGQGHRADLAFGNECSYELQAADYKPQQFREEDGWRVDCNPDQAWKPKTTYNSGDAATVGDGSVIHKYSCNSTHCDGRPGSSSQWSKQGRCR
jgi:hypothetical protein